MTTNTTTETTTERAARLERTGHKALAAITRAIANGEKFEIG